MRILSATTIWLLVSGAPADQAACRPFIPVARAAIGEVLAKQGVPLRPERPDAVRDRLGR